jgi:1-acyl-sn-glycerol-3-phosphate acyltransferase
MWRTLKARRIEAVVHFGEPQAAMGRDRRAWSQDLRRDITALRETS